MPEDFQMMLTVKQMIELEFIQDFIQRHTCPPTFREIGRGTGIRSTNTVAFHLWNLEQKGVLERQSGAARGLTNIGQRL